MAAHRKALRFADEKALQAALALLEDLSESGPVEYDIVAGSEAIVLPTWVYRRLAPLLEKEQVGHRESKLRSMSELSPKEQAQRRGLGRRNIA